MANPTPEQRKEAAECLRDANIRIYDWVSDYDIAAMIGVENYKGDKDSTDELLERLAELIDPTCRMIQHKQPVGSTYECTSCGHELGVYEVDIEHFQFCPNCGSTYCGGGLNGQ